MPMHKIIFVTLYLLQIVPAHKGIRIGDSCETNRDCISQHCASICNKQESVCIQATWFYLRHGLQVPTCIEQNLIKVKFPHANERQVGETCHSNNNCNSKHCIPLCGPDQSIWRCVESRSYYEQKKIKVPTCFEEKNNENGIGMNTKNKEDDSSFRQLGESCLNDLSCLSGNCSPTCDAPESESLCNVPRWLLTVNNIPVPECMDRNRLPELAHMSKDNSTKKSHTRYLVPATADHNLISSEQVKEIEKMSLRRTEEARRLHPVIVSPFASCGNFIRTMIVKYLF